MINTSSSSKNQQNHSVDDMNPQNYDNANSLLSTNIDSKIITPSKSTSDQDFALHGKDNDKGDEAKENSKLHTGLLVSQSDNQAQPIKIDNSESNEIIEWKDVFRHELGDDKEVNNQIRHQNSILNSNLNLLQLLKVITPKALNLGNKSLFSEMQKIDILDEKKNNTFDK